MRERGGSVRIDGVGGSTRLAEGNQQTVRLAEPLGCQAAITVEECFNELINTQKFSSQVYPLFY